MLLPKKNEKLNYMGAGNYNAIKLKSHKPRCFVAVCDILVQMDASMHVSVTVTS